MTSRQGLFPAVVAIAIAFFGCHDVAPERAPGFSAEGLRKLSLGMTVGEIRAVMGAPLPSVIPGTDPSGKELLSYAQPGARWWFGEYKSKVKGPECLLWLKDKRLIAVRVMDEEARAMCVCQEGSCKPDWAEPCLRSLVFATGRP